MEQELLAYSTIRKVLGDVSQSTVRRLIAKGDLPIVKLGRRTFVPRSAVVAFLRSRSATVVAASRKV